MGDFLNQRFPDQLEAIEKLLKHDSAFAEMCADYEEACAWLADQDRARGFSRESDHALELVRDLECEIAKALSRGRA